VRPCASASRIGISANHQRPSRTSLPANLISAPCTPFAELLARAVRSPQYGAARTPRLRRLSKHHAGCRGAGTAIRMPEDASPAHAFSPCSTSVHQDVSPFLTFDSDHADLTVFRVSATGQVRPVARSTTPWAPTGVAVSRGGEWAGAQSRVRRVSARGVSTIF
jgi:hypothetical protein